MALPKKQNKTKKNRRYLVNAHLVRFIKFPLYVLEKCFLSILQF